MAEWRVWANVGKNRLYIVLSGFFTDEESRLAADSVIVTLKRLQPGFDCITDLTTHKPGSTKAADETRRAQAFLVKHGVRRVIRVVTSSALSQFQFARTGNDAGYAEGTVDVACSIAEAEAKLDGSV